MNLVQIAEIFLGAYFLFFGLNGFFNWIKIPKPNARMFEFVLALDRASFILPVVKVIEIVGGGLLISGYAVNLAIFLLLPISLVIILSQLILNRPKGLDVVLLIAVPFIFIIISKWSSWFEFLVLK